MNVVGQINDSRQRAWSVSMVAVIILRAVFSRIFRFRQAVTAGMALAVGLLLLCAPAHALTIDPTTWNIIGLDSNKVETGPNIFPVGALVCNDSGSTRTITVTFDFDDANDNYTGDAYINLRAGTLEAITFTDVPDGECREAFFEAEVTRDSNAYNNLRGFTITADDGTDTVSTPTGSELFVEHLLSQSRNAVLDVQLSTDGGSSYDSYGEGETMTVMVGQTYHIKLVADTATNGYEQLEAFLNFPNSVFEVLSVSSTYTADSSPTVPDPNPQVYADGCIWDGLPTSNNYSSCLSTGKAGGDITVTYEVKVLQVPPSQLTNPAQISTLIYDFSGSSYHYNADYPSIRYVDVVNANIEKSFTPKTVNPNTDPPETSTLTFTITNPGPDPITNVNFVDNLPTNGGAGQMSIAGTTVTYTDCGASPSPASLTVGATSLSFSGMTIAGLSTGTIEVTVTVDATGTYPNDSENLFINSTIDTGDDARDTLVAADKPPGPTGCTPASSLATWTTITAAPPTPTTQAGDVSTATATAAFTGGGSQSVVSGAWAVTDEFPGVGVVPDPATATTYYQFQVDTSHYGGAQISFDTELTPNGKWAAKNDMYVFASPDGTNYTQIYSILSMTKSLLSHGPIVAADAGSNDLTGPSYTWFRIYNVGQKKPNDPGTVLLSNISIEGCPRPEYPTLTKSFADISICEYDYSSLTFTFTNPNSTSLTGVGFTDTLPAGLLVNTPNGTPTVSCTTGSSSGETITATAGTSTISMSGATLAANSSCSFSVDIEGSLKGDYMNVSNNITSTETGVNTTSTGYDTADLAVFAPPVINKTFGQTYLITGQSTSLTFSISNPNSHGSLTGVAFTDTLPSGLVVATPNGLSGGCGSGTITATAGSGTISLSGATLTAGSSCTFSVDVTGSTAGLKSNSVTVTSTNGCTGNTATAELLVRAIIPSIGFMKQVGPSATGPWFKYLPVTTGDTVYYRFIVENTGETPLTGISVTDPLLNPTFPYECTCTWTTPIPVADASDDDHIEYCVPTETITALLGYHPNTATVSSNEVADKDDTAAYEAFDPTAVTMGRVELVAVKVSDFLSGIGVSELDADGLLNLLNAWDPTAAKWLKDAGRDTLLAAITDYLDPDGDALVVVLRWETVEERGTIGFYAERRQGGNWARINARMLPGLIAAPMGAQYWLADPDALPGDNYQYRLIEVEARGTTREYGPFDLKVGNALK